MGLHLVDSTPVRFDAARGKVVVHADAAHALTPLYEATTAVAGVTEQLSV